MKTMKREVYNRESMTQLVKNDLKQFNISEVVIDAVIKSYINMKRELLANGSMIYEEGISTEQLLIRQVSKKFTEIGYTFKLKGSIDSGYKNMLIDKINTDEDFQDIMNFDPNKRFLED